MEGWHNKQKKSQLTKMRKKQGGQAGLLKYFMSFFWIHMLPHVAYLCSDVEGSLMINEHLFELLTEVDLDWTEHD